jgi:hypothetical protein
LVVASVAGSAVPRVVDWVVSMAALSAVEKAGPWVVD